MKRKLNENDEPEETNAPVASEQVSFQSLGLDPRVLQGVLEQKWTTPTPVQTKAIPLALQGRDILARAATGSGKTAAYLLPILDSLLRSRSARPAAKSTFALILVPTRELASQIAQTITALLSSSRNDVRHVNLSSRESQEVQRARLAETPDIVVSTPAPAAANLKCENMKLEGLSCLVIDEADLVLSYGYEEDLTFIADCVPKGVQTILMSATLRAEVDQMKRLFCHDPAVLELDDPKTDQSGLSQYVVKCGEEEKFLLLYALFGLKLVKGKCIVFVGEIDRSYRVKLYLEQFGIKSCVLNSELPVNSRIHVVEEFNRGIYDIIIATDEKEIVGGEDERLEKNVKEVGQDEDGEQDAVDADDEGREHPERLSKTNNDGAADQADLRPQLKKHSKKNRPSKSDKEYGISRGIDFRQVSLVLNFDLPLTSKSYTHRIGRTARAGRSGMALSFVIPKSQYRKHKPTTLESTASDEEVLAKITKSQARKGKEVSEYKFDMKALEGFRYRMGDALRAVTRIAVREARAREIRQELIKSEKLKRYFEENPDELRHLMGRHDTESRTARTQAHLRHVPDYLLPGGAKSIGSTGKNGVGAGFVSFAKDREGENRIRRARMMKKGKKGGGKVPNTGRPKKLDPLKTFHGKSKR